MTNLTKMGIIVMTTQTADTQDPSKPRQPMSAKFRQYTIMEAFLHQREQLLQKEKCGLQTFPTQYEFVLCRLQCKECLNSGSTLIPVGNQKFLHAVQHTQKQLDTQFVMGFCSVVAQDSHINVPPHRTNKSYRWSSVHILMEK
jgi:hypothetical protein